MNCIRCKLSIPIEYRHSDWNHQTMREMSFGKSRCHSNNSKVYIFIFCSWFIFITVCVVKVYRVEFYQFNGVLRASAALATAHPSCVCLPLCSTSTFIIIPASSFHFGLEAVVEKGRVGFVGCREQGHLSHVFDEVLRVAFVEP